MHLTVDGHLDHLHWGAATTNASTNVLNIIWCMYAYTTFGQMPKWKCWIIIQAHIHNKTWACLVG